MVCLFCAESNEMHALSHRTDIYLWMQMLAKGILIFLNFFKSFHKIFQINSFVLSTPRLITKVGPKPSAPSVAYLLSKKNLECKDFTFYLAKPSSAGPSYAFRRMFSFWIVWQFIYTFIFQFDMFSHSFN